MTQVSFKLPWGKLRGLSMGNRSSNNIYICIHGWQDNSALFRPLIEKLPQENHYISLDMIGHGLSDPLPTGMCYNFTNWALSLHHVIQQLETEKVSLIGHSLGGGISGFYSSIFPENVEKLVLLDSGGMPLIRADYQKHARKSFEQYANYVPREPNHYTKKEVIQRLKVGVSRLNSSLTDEAINFWFERGVHPKENGKFSIARDHRLSLNTTSCMGFDQLESLWNILTESDIEIMTLAATTKEQVENGTQEDHSKNKDGVAVMDFDAAKNNYLSLFNEFSRKIGEKNSCRKDWIVGNHHFFVNNPEETAEKLTSFIKGM